MNGDLSDGNRAIADFKGDLSKIELEWSTRVKAIKKSAESPGFRAAILSGPAFKDSGPLSAQNLEIFLDTRFEALKKEVHAFKDQWKKLKKESEAGVQNLSSYVAQFESRVGTLENQFREIGDALSEVKKIELSILEARQKQYESYIEDRSKLRVDYLDLKQEVTQKLKIMQIRIEDLITANAAQSFKPVEPPAGADLDMSQFGSSPVEEKTLLRKFIDWWKEPVLTFSESKEAPHH